MVKPYDTAVTYLHRIKKDGRLTEETEARTDRSIDLFHEGRTRTLIMCGCEEKDGKFAADTMKRRAILRGVPQDVVFQEFNGFDTVGEMIFSKMDFVIPSDMGRIIMVSSRYHIPRIQRIAEVVYGNEFEVLYEAARDGPWDIDPNNHTRLKNPQSLEAFLRTFEGIRPGDDRAFLTRLFEAHSLYKERDDLRRKYLQ